MLITSPQQTSLINMTSLLFRHVINLVDFFEGVSESVIVMEFAEGWHEIIVVILSFCLGFFWNIINLMLILNSTGYLHSLFVGIDFDIFSGTDLFATLSAVHYELTEAKCRIIIAQVIHCQVHCKCLCILKMYIHS